MSLTNVASITPTSATLRDGCTDETNNELIVVESTTPSLIRYNLSTQVQAARWGTSTGPSCVTLVAPGVAAIGYSGTSSIDFMQLSTGFRLTAVAGTTTSTVKGQLMAADYSLQMGFMTSSTSRQYFKFDYAAGGVVTAFANSQINTNSQTNCVILKSTGRFLFGTTAGQVLEVDSMGNVVDLADFGNVPTSGNISVSTNTANAINSLSYDNNMLLICWSNGNMQLVDWSTKEVLANYPNSISMLSHSSSGVCLMGRNIATTTTNNCIFEVDFTTGAPISYANPLFTDQTSAILSLGMNTVTGRGWALQTTPRIRIFDVAPRGSTTRTFTVQPSGSNVPFRLLVLDRTGGVGTTTRIIDTYAQSPGTYRVPTGKTLLVAVGYGEGANALYQGSQITT